MILWKLTLRQKGDKTSNDISIINLNYVISLGNRKGGHFDIEMDLNSGRITKYIYFSKNWKWSINLIKDFQNSKGNKRGAFYKAIFGFCQLQ